MDFELEHRIRYEYELEQISKSIKEQAQNREFNVQLTASSAKEDDTYVINFTLVNEINVSMIQFDITLPNGVSIDRESFVFYDRITQAVINITTINNLTRIIFTPEDPTSIIPGNDNIFKIVFTESSIKNKTIMISNINITALKPSQYSCDSINVRI